MDIQITVYDKENQSNDFEMLLEFLAKMELNHTVIVADASKSFDMDYELLKYKKDK